jgi:hypothetical protein
MSARNSPGGDVDGDIVQRRHFEGIALENLADVANLHDPCSGSHLIALCDCAH